MAILFLETFFRFLANVSVGLIAETSMSDTGSFEFNFSHQMAPGVGLGTESAHYINPFLFPSPDNY